MNDTKTKKTFTDYGFGFPVLISNASLRKVRGSWELDINFEKYEKVVLLALSLKPTKLTGNELKFIRNFFSMTLKSFGERFGDVAHSAVIKWEKVGDLPTNMNWPTEKDIRLAIINKLDQNQLISTYAKLEKVATHEFSEVKIKSIA